MTHAERQRRYRERHPEYDRDKWRERSARYAMTAKGLLRTARQNARRRESHAEQD